MLGLGLGFTGRAVLGGSGAATYDYYIATTGSDAAAGTQAAPFASFTPLITLIDALPDAGRLTAYVAAGTYFQKRFSFGAGVNAGVHATVTFADGCIMSGGSDGVTDQSWLDMTGTTAWTLELIGLGAAGLRVTGFDAGTGNGLGMAPSGGALLIARNVHVDDCIDGVSLHGANAKCEVYDCTFANCSKGAFSHVHLAGYFKAYRSTFTAQAASIQGVGSCSVANETVSITDYYEDCSFIPVTAGQAVAFGRGTLVRCQVGTLAIYASPNWGGAAGAAIVEDSYVRAAWDLQYPVEMTRCYGYIAMRMRNDVVTSRLNHCAFRKLPTIDGILYANFDPGSQAKLEMLDTVIMGHATAVGSGYSAAYAGYFIASGSLLRYCNLYNNTVDIDADLAAANATDGGTKIANNVDMDPVFAGGETLLQSAWCVTAAGLIGTGSAGSNIGFTAADIA